jgi:DNA-binding NarL/FixJ family response regulator
MLRVLVAEDHPMFREALVALLTGLPETTVVASTDTVLGLLSAATDHAPDLAVVDLSLADGSALAALGQLRIVAPRCRVLVLTSADDDGAVYSALRSGAHGYLLKSSAPDEIVRAVRTVSGGAGVYDGTVVDRITRHLTTGGRASSTALFPRLSDRERDVLALIAEGLSNAQIADHYVLSLKTVRNHVSNVLTKLGVATRAEAIVAAREAGLGPETNLRSVAGTHPNRQPPNAAGRVR